MLLPPCFTVFFEKFIWNSRNFGWRTFLWASFPNKFVFVSSLQWLLCHFFEPSVTCQSLWQKTKFSPIFKVAVLGKGTLRAILLGCFGFSKRRWTVPRDMTFPSSLAIAFDDIEGSRLANVTMRLTMAGEVSVAFQESFLLWGHFWVSYVSVQVIWQRISTFSLVTEAFGLVFSPQDCTDVQIRLIIF